MKKVLSGIFASIVFMIFVCGNIMAAGNTLSPGISSGKVLILQQLLAALGYFDEEPTGYYGTLTEEAVFEYQEENGLEANGIADALTLQHMGFDNWMSASGYKSEYYGDYAESVLSAISYTPSTAAGECSAWIRRVLVNAGILTYDITLLRPQELSYAVIAGLADSNYSDDTDFNANDYWAYVCYSKNPADLQPGMIIATRNSYSYLGRQFGHVGFYIGAGLVISSVGYLETLSLEEFIDNYNNEEMGSTAAWGYFPYNNDQLSPEDGGDEYWEEDVPEDQDNDQNGPVISGWLLYDGNWYYLDSNGNIQTGWLYDNGNWYYLYPSGAMATGWILDNGCWYYLSPWTGAMYTGWLYDNSCWYYLSPWTGAMYTGWILYNYNWYYMYPWTGTMYIGWMFDENTSSWYYFQEDGTMVTGDCLIGGTWYVFDNEGIWIG